MYRNRRNYENIYDHGYEPFAANISKLTNSNRFFRTALWTGEYLQVTLMSIPVGGSIGLEMHPDVDQFLRIESGHGVVKMGEEKNHPTFVRRVDDNFAIIIPAGTWHNLMNIGSTPIKLYSIYAPPNHPFGTIHETKEIAERNENH